MCTGERQDETETGEDESDREDGERVEKRIQAQYVSKADDLRGRSASDRGNEGVERCLFDCKGDAEKVADPFPFELLVGVEVGGQELLPQVIPQREQWLVHAGIEARSPVWWRGRSGRRGQDRRGREGRIGKRTDFGVGVDLLARGFVGQVAVVGLGRSACAGVGERGRIHARVSDRRRPSSTTNDGGR